MLDELSEADIKFLRDCYEENSKKQFHRISARRNEDRRNYHNDKEKGLVVRWQDCVPLERWYRKTFDLGRASFGGQLGIIKQPLGVHADILWDVPNHVTRSEHCTTSYSVLETDCIDTLHTYIFDQYVDRDKWTGLKDGIESIHGLVETKVLHGYPHEAGRLAHLYPNAKALGLTIKEKLPLPIGKIVSWPSHHLHSGQDFKSAGGSWKLHLTLITQTSLING